MWNKFWSGGMTDTLKIVIQISYLLFMRRLEVLDSLNQQRAKASKESYESIFAGHDDYRWSHWKNMNANDMMDHVQNKVFPFLKNLQNGEDTLFAQYMRNATFEVPKPSVLQGAISILDDLNISSQAHDVQGDIFEELLSELKESGKNGQFRTPRHIIRMMIELVNPQIGETICDPACGTGGFLINAYEHILKNNTSESIIKFDDEGLPYNLIGDKIVKKEHWNLLRNKAFYGFDFDGTMLRIGVMNMILHGIKQPNIVDRDSLSKRFDQTKQYDILLANPPFAGSIDEGDINDNFRISSGKTELLFLQLFCNILKIGGRAGIIVPEGALFSTSNAHKKIRKMLLEKCRIDGIISMPVGVFKPYTGSVTSVIFFTKGEPTKEVWFYEMKNDGLSLNDKREKIEENDIPDIIEKFKKKIISEKSWLASIQDITKNNWNLSASRYKPFSQSEKKSPSPKKILEEINKIDLEIKKHLREIQQMLEIE